jgi:hypothetical protein
VLALAGLAACALVGACGWDPARPFERNAPAVDQAIRALDAGDATAATTLLSDYLSTGACDKGSIGTPEIVNRRPNGAIDLGLSLFAIAEAYGGRFGEEADGGGTKEEQVGRLDHVLCALRIVKTVAEDEKEPIEARARARALEGNLNFLAAQYEGAVEAYDKALALTPGREEPKDGAAEVHPLDALGRDVAWNRAIALKRIEDKKKDGGSDGGGDSGDGGGDGGGDDGGHDGGDSGGGGDGGGDSGGGGNDGGDGGGQGGGDGGRDGGGPDGGQDGGDGSNRPDAGAPPPPPSRSDRVLDQLERAPTVQQEVARKAARAQRVQGAADK